MNFHIITLFPEIFDSYLKESILGRAIKNKKIKINFVNPRKFVTGKYKKVWPDGNVSLQVDDRPYAGGPGMVMQALPIIKAVEFINTSILKRFSRSSPARRSYDADGNEGGRGARPQKSLQNLRSKILIVNFIPSAEKFNTKMAKNISAKYTDVIMICGRYEGIDARVDKILKTKKISVGDYVLTGGEIPAMILIDSISRQIKGVLGNYNSLEEERISSSIVYTRPEVIEYKSKKYKVPKVLIGGDHKKIEDWKNKNNIKNNIKNKSS
jgi:tRNA (guanine37-N1)-methyltransferase